MLVVLQTLSAGKLSSYMNKFQVNATLKDLTSHGISSSFTIKLLSVIFLPATNRLL